jgi:disulfide bond formation protein DsbB
MSQVLNDLRSKADEQIFLFLIVCAGVLVMALGLEHIGGYLPCELCLKERYAYYAGVVLAIGASAAFSSGRSGLAAALIAGAGLLLVANAGLGLYHAGIEWHWWAGPSTCTGNPNALASNADDLLKSLQNQNVVRCDQPALKIAGLSLAAWNIPIGLGLAALAGNSARLLVRPNPLAAS